MNIKSIAQQTGYSESTVSRALNHDPRISAKTTQIIQETATRLNYQKDFAAMNLNHQESNIVAVIFPPESDMNINNPFYIEIVKQAAYVAAQQHYMVSVIMAQTRSELSQKIQMMLTQGKVRKFIMLYNLPGDPVVTQLKRSDVNLVVIGNPDDDQVVFVDNDNYQVGQAVGNQLLADEAQAPVYIMSARRWKFEVDRRAGLMARLATAGQSIQTIEFASDNQASINEIQALQQSSKPVVVSSDDLLVKLYGVFTLTPQQPVISFNNSVFIQPISQQIRSVDLHPREMGSLAATLLFKQPFDQVQHANWVGFTL